MKIGQKLTVSAWVYQSKRGLDKITKFTEEAFYPIVNIETSFFHSQNVRKDLSC